MAGERYAAFLPRDATPRGYCMRRLVQLGRKTPTSMSWLADFGFLHDSLRCTTGIDPRSDSFPAVYRLPAVAVSLIDDRALQAHLYADDTQLYAFCPPSESLDL